MYKSQYVIFRETNLLNPRILMSPFAFCGDTICCFLLVNFSSHVIACTCSPRAHTCFNRLDLPPYVTYNEFNKPRGWIITVKNRMDLFHL